MNAPLTRSTALDFVLRHEGGYVNDPDDPGGETRYGISRASYPHLDIANLSLEQARAIYQDDYWFASGCDRLPVPIACVLFDAAVQHGVHTASQMLQHALGVTADGRVGPVTAAAAHAADAGKIVRRVMIARAQLYCNLAQMQGKAKFYRGWITRLFDLQRAILGAV